MFYIRWAVRIQRFCSWWLRKNYIGLAHVLCYKVSIRYHVLQYDSSTDAILLMAKNAVFFQYVYWLFVSTLLISVQEKQYNLEDLLYNVDDEGSTLLHLAVDSGSLPVRSHNLWIWQLYMLMRMRVTCWGVDYKLNWKSRTYPSPLAVSEVHQKFHISTKDVTLQKKKKCEFNVKHRECLRNHPSQRLMIKCLTIIQFELEFRNVCFWGEEKTRRKTSRSRLENQQRLPQWKSSSFSIRLFRGRLN